MFQASLKQFHHKTALKKTVSKQKHFIAIWFFFWGGGDTGFKKTA